MLGAQTQLFEYQTVRSDRLRSVPVRPDRQGLAVPVDVAHEGGKRMYEGMKWMQEDGKWTVDPRSTITKTS